MKKPTTSDISSKVKKATFELANFPTLHVNVLGEKITVVGTLAIVDKGIEIDSYALEIELDDKHPDVPPLVFEVTGRIPRTLDRHVYPDTGSLCLGVREEIWPRPGCQIHLGSL